MIKANIPLAIQVVIDDVGWWSGEDSSLSGGPFRTGIKRNHCIKDYEAIFEFAKRLKIRPQIAMVLCEWDRENILGELPTSTWMGTGWNNSRWLGPWLDEAAILLTQRESFFII